jgi:small-conductance mechanosensitive channel
MKTDTTREATTHLLMCLVTDLADYEALGKQISVLIRALAAENGVAVPFPHVAP